MLALTGTGLDSARRDLATAERRLANLVEAIADGRRSPSLRQQLDALETKCEALRVQIGAPLPPRPVFPADLAETYRRRVGELEHAIADRKTPAVQEAARALIGRVVIHTPPDDGSDHPIEVEGEIEVMLRAGGMTGPVASMPQKAGGSQPPVPNCSPVR